MLCLFYPVWAEDLASNKVLTTQGLNDPMRPIYLLDVEFGKVQQSIEGIEAEIVNVVPAIEQLIIGDKRKLVIMGGLLLREGDTAQFGKIVRIDPNEVIVDVKGIEETIYFRDKNNVIAQFKK